MGGKACLHPLGNSANCENPNEFESHREAIAEAMKDGRIVDDER